MARAVGGGSLRKAGREGLWKRWPLGAMRRSRVLVVQAEGMEYANA